MTDCQCCTGVEMLTSGAIYNPQGLTSIAYRVGEHGSFFESMLATLAGDRDFGLRTRETDDFSVAVLDAASVVCDILSFYQQQFANEHYLRTATERQSLVGLGRLLGYPLAPGRAAATFLAFTLESPVVPPAPAIAGLPPGPYPNPGAIEGIPPTVPIPRGTKVQSVPGPGETPQIFETVEDITAKPGWNSIPLRLRATYPSGAASFNQIELAGFVNALKEGDWVLLQQGSGTPVFNQVTKVDTQTTIGRTVVTVSGGTVPNAQLPSLADEPTSTAPADFDSAYIASAIRGVSWSQPDLETIADSRRWNTDRLEKAIRSSQASDAAGVAMTVLGAAAALYGNNARDFNATGGIEIIARQVAAEHFLGYAVTGQTDSTIAAQSAGANSFFLDNTNQAAVAGRWIVLDDPGHGTLAAQISTARDVSLSLFDLRGRVTQIAITNLSWLGTPGSLGNFSLRNTRVLIGTASATATPPLITLSSANSDAGGDTLRLDGPYFGLKAGQNIVVTGSLTSLPGQTAFESATVAKVTLDDGFTVLLLSQELTNRYSWESVRVLANVAEATHGETVTETLGGGDPSTPFQRFKLKQNPLTYVSAAVPSGILPSITVRIAGIAWTLVDNLFAAGSQDRVYTLQIDSDGTAWVVFGDGTTGARLPSGSENVTASYRRGLGSAGNLDAGQLSLAMSRPLGLNSVVNPVSATGGADPETLEESRVSMPFPMRTLGRIVTLQDYEEFARASAGVAKSSADWLWNGHRWIALITIAGPGGAVIPAGTPAFDDLRTALKQAGDEQIIANLVDFRPRFFDIDASLIVDSAYVADTVLANAISNLRTSFGFVARAFAQPVYLSEVITVLQKTEGVIAVALNALFYTGTTPDLTAAADDVLTADGPSRSGSTLLGAELLTLDEGPLNGVRVRL